jgi:hypothetical protein
MAHFLVKSAVFIALFVTFGCDLEIYECIINSQQENLKMGKKKIELESGELPVDGSVRIESRYQPGLLRQCISEGISAESMMDRLEIKNMQTLRKHLLRLMAEDKTFYDIEGLFQRGSNVPKVNPKGRLTLNLRGIVIAGQEVTEGDLFQVRVEEDHIVLTRA